MVLRKVERRASSPRYPPRFLPLCNCVMHVDSHGGIHNGGIPNVCDVSMHIMTAWMLSCIMVVLIQVGSMQVSRESDRNS